MTDTMIGRVAKAIADANGHDYELYPKLSEALARAAIEALREPTEAMVEAAAISDAKFDGRTFNALGRADKQRYLDRARASLDAALSEGAER